MNKLGFIDAADAKEKKLTYKHTALNR